MKINENKNGSSIVFACSGSLLPDALEKNLSYKPSVGGNDTETFCFFLLSEIKWKIAIKDYSTNLSSEAFGWH